MINGSLYRQGHSHEFAKGDGSSPAGSRGKALVGV